MWFILEGKVRSQIKNNGWYCNISMVFMHVFLTLIVVDLLWNITLWTDTHYTCECDTTLMPFLFFAGGLQNHIRLGDSFYIFIYTYTLEVHIWKLFYPLNVYFRTGYWFCKNRWIKRNSLIPLRNNPNTYLLVVQENHHRPVLVGSVLTVQLSHSYQEPTIVSSDGYRIWFRGVKYESTCRFWMCWA